MPVLNNILYGLLNTHTGEAQTFSKVTTWIDGSAMDDSKCDGTIFRKKDADYFKLNYTGPVNIKWFGAKGDGTTDDTPAFQRFIDAFAGVGETALLEHGTFLLKDLVVPTGYRFLSNQKPANNSYAFVNATVCPAPGAEYIFIFPATTRYAALENLNINGDYQHHPQLLAAVSFTGAYNKLLGNNINACAQACVLMPEATTCTIKDNFMGGWFGPPPVFTDINDFRGTLQIEVCGDSYIVDNEVSASLPYFTAYTDPADVLRDKVKGRICAMAIRTYFGNSVCTGNIFENGDRAVVLAGCVYSYFAGNRYELSAMGNLYVRGAMYNTTFMGERFADGSLAGDGSYDDIELATGAVGNVAFISPTFLILSNEVVPASSFKVRHNLTNYASMEIAWVEPLYNPDYVANEYINPSLPAFPVREVVGQYYPQSPVYKSSLTIGKRLPNDDPAVETTGYVKIDAGTTIANQNRTGIVGWYKANDLRVSAIGFDNADNAMSFALSNPGVYAFSNGGLFAAKNGGSYLNLQSNDGQGACAINFYSNPAQTKVGLISLNSDTGQFNVVASGQMLFQSPGFTFIGGDITVAKAGGVSLGLLSSDKTGTSMFRMSSDPLAAHEFRIAMNNATGVTRLSSGDDIIIGGTGGGNMKFQQNGLTFIPQTPSAGTTSNSYLLGRNTTTGELTVIDAAGIAPAPGGTSYIQNQNAAGQVANQWISGNGRFDAGLIVGGNFGSGSALNISSSAFRASNSISSNQNIPKGVVASLTITNAGTGYTPGAYNVAATGGTGTGLTMGIIVGSGGTVTSAFVVIINQNYGSGYTAGDSVSGTFGGGSGFAATVTLRADAFASIINTDTFATSGADEYYGYRGLPAINQTGSAAGTIYGFYWSPTLTSLQGNNVAWQNSTGDVRLCFTSGKVSIGAAPATSAGTYDFLTRNTSTGVVEKVPAGSMPYIQNQSTTSQSANLYISGTARIGNVQFTPLPSDATAYPTAHYGLTLHSNGTVQKLAGGFLPLTPSLSTPILGPVYMAHSGTLKLQFSGPDSIINFYTDAGGYTGMFGASSSGMVLRSMLNKPMSLQGGTLSNSGYSPSNITIAADGTLDSSATSYKYNPNQGTTSNAYWIAPSSYRPVSNVARGLYISGNFTTVANNDVIVGIDIDNTVNNYASYTGVKKIDIRTTGDVKFGGVVTADGGATLSGNVSTTNPRMGVANVAAGATMDATCMLQVFTGIPGSTIYLPAAANNTGRMLIVKNQTGNSVTVATTGGVNEIYYTAAIPQATLSTNASGTTVYMSDGTYWNVISKY